MQSLGKKEIGADSVQLSTTVNVEGKQALMSYTTIPGSVAATNAMFSALIGIRYFMPFFNRNEIYNVGGLSIAYLTNRPHAYTKDEYVNYTQYTAANSTHLYHDSVAANVDSGVHDWNEYPGLSVGCWFKLDSLGAERALVTNWDAPATDAVYRLYISSDNHVNFDVSPSGVYSANDHAKANANELVTGTWYYATGRWSPGAYVQVAFFDVGEFIESATAMSSIATTLYRPTLPRFRIGALIGGGPIYSYMNGAIAYPWMAVTETSGEQRNMFWKVSRRQFQ